MIGVRQSGASGPCVVQSGLRCEVLPLVLGVLGLFLVSGRQPWPPPCRRWRGRTRPLAASRGLRRRWRWSSRDRRRQSRLRRGLWGDSATRVTSSSSYGSASSSTPSMLGINPFSTLHSLPLAAVTSRPAPWEVRANVGVVAHPCAWLTPAASGWGG